MMACQNCHNTRTVKHGFVRDKQRYKCHLRGYNFVRGDARHCPTTEIQKALCMILYALGKASFGLLAQLFGMSRTTADAWIRPAAARTAEPTIAEAMQAIECDEMGHLIQAKKEPCGSLTPWMVAQGKPLPGYSVVVMLQPANGSPIPATLNGLAL